MSAFGRPKKRQLEFNFLLNGGVPEWSNGTAWKAVARKGLVGSVPGAHQPPAENLFLFMFYVYVLWSSHLQKRYVGSAKDYNSRFREHNRGKNKFTKGGIPWALLYTEECKDLSSARKRELFLKSGVG